MKRLLGLAALFSLLIGGAMAQLNGGLIFPGPGTSHSVGACAGWTPTTPAGLVGWYKADVGVTGSSPVTAWADQSGHGYTMNPNGFTGPTLNNTGLNGKETLDFTGGFATGLRTTFDTVTLGTGTDSSVFMLGSATASSAVSGGWTMVGNGQTQGTDNSHSFAIYTLGSGPTYAATTNFDLPIGSEAFTVDTETRFGYTWTVLEATPYVNGVAGTVGTTRTVTFTSPGALQAANGQFDGKIRELIFYTTKLGSTDLGCMDAYLVSRQ